MNASTRGSLTFGLLCALAGSLVAIVLLVGSRGQWWLLVTAPAAAFICGTAFWRLLPERSPGPTRLRGTLAGGLTGVVSHFVAWYLGYLGANLCFLFTGGCTNSLGEPPADPFAAFPGAAGFTFFSLLVAGWATLPIGALLGFLFAKKSKPTP